MTSNDVMTMSPPPPPLPPPLRSDHLQRTRKRLGIQPTTAWMQSTWWKSLQTG
jgi:hypothetical protein